MTDGARKTSWAQPPIGPGAMVEVRNTFNGSWTKGFAVQAIAPDGYRLRRLADEAILPATFSPNVVRLQQ